MREADRIGFRTWIMYASAFLESMEILRMCA